MCFLFDFLSCFHDNLLEVIRNFGNDVLIITNTNVEILEVCTVVFLFRSNEHDIAIKKFIKSKKFKSLLGGGIRGFKNIGGFFTSYLKYFNSIALKKKYDVKIMVISQYTFSERSLIFESVEILEKNDIFENLSKSGSYKKLKNGLTNHTSNLLVIK